MFLFLVRMHTVSSFYSECRCSISCIERTKKEENTQERQRHQNKSSWSQRAADHIRKLSSGRRERGKKTTGFFLGFPSAFKLNGRLVIFTALPLSCYGRPVFTFYYQNREPDAYKKTWRKTSLSTTRLVSGHGVLRGSKSQG